MIVMMIYELMVYDKGGKQAELPGLKKMISTIEVKKSSLRIEMMVNDNRNKDAELLRLK